MGICLAVFVTNTYTYDAYGILLKKTGTFISMDSYAGSLDNPVSLHKYLYAYANPVMYTDPTGYSPSHENAIAAACRSILDTASINSLKILHKTMQ